MTLCSTKVGSPTPSQQPHVPGRVQTDYAPDSGRSPCWCGTSAGSCSSSAAEGTCWARARCPGPELECRSSQASAEGHTLSLTSPGGATSQRHTHTVLSGAESSGLKGRGAQQCPDPHFPPADNETPPHKQPWWEEFVIQDMDFCLSSPPAPLPAPRLPPPFHRLYSSRTPLPILSTWVLSTL